MAIAFLFLNMWDSKSLAPMIEEEVSNSPSLFLTTLESVVRLFDTLMS